MKFLKAFCAPLMVVGMGLLIVGCAAKDGSGGSWDKDGDGSYDAGVGFGTLKRIYFPFDQSVITGTAADTLKDNVGTMKSNSSMRVLVEGHCDDRGTNEYNIALGERRAKTTLDYMVSMGVARNRLEMKSWGEERPLSSGQTEDSYRKNRRAEFVILAK